VTHLRATDDMIETASLYVLGALPADERAAFEQHLAEGCRACEHEVATLASVAGELGHAAPLTVPRPEVRERLLARLASPPTLVRASAGGWENGPFGLAVRRLDHDAAEGRVTSLVRMPPGARYPGHRHASVEELYLLQGDLTVEGERLGVGDYCAAASETVHGETTTEGGCTFVLVTSEADEMSSNAPTPSATRAGLTFVRAAEGEWRSGVAPGVEIRRLHADRARGKVTTLVRMAAGTRLPDDRPLIAEQLYMLSGNAQIAGETLEVGDYYGTTGGTSQGVTHTESGCEFLLVASS
jgi:anti-sigma factor ChrR (cupin superfamily)